MPSSADLTADRCLQRLVAAQEAGEDIRACIVDVYRAFARDAAERWFIHCGAGGTLQTHAAHLADAALGDQLEVVPRLNLEHFGYRDRAFDRQCSAATREAFHARKRELMAGWGA